MFNVYWLGAFFPIVGLFIPELFFLDFFFGKDVLTQK